MRKAANFLVEVLIRLPGTGLLVGDSYPGLL